MLYTSSWFDRMPPGYIRIGISIGTPRGQHAAPKIMALAPGTAFLAWKCGALAFAVLAPTLAVARVARSVRRGAVEGEFRRWFPDTAPPGPHTGRVRPTTDVTHDV